MKKLLLVLLSICLLTLSACSNHVNLSDDNDDCVVENVDSTIVPDYTYNIVGTDQTNLYNNFTEVTDLQEGDPFYGQDGNYEGLEPLYKDNCDGTITDLNTGLMWSQSTDLNGDGSMTSEDKMTYSEAVDSVQSFDLAGYDDWRLPTIKELYSLILFSGEDVSGYNGTDTSSLTPFIDTDYFEFYYGLTDEGERIIDSQYLSSTTYVDTDNYDTLIFGVNFADGRIKGYGMRGMDGSDKTFSIIYVRGNEQYGENDFYDNQDGTITDNATGLMWMQSGSEDTYNWEEALSYAEGMDFAGYDDWRLPTIKELQSIIDYTKSPDTSNSPAIDELFTLTSFMNEGNELDWGYYWSGTTHNSYRDASNAAYVSFGRALGYMNNWIDVHGAGAQRSDPKTGNPDDYPTGFGPQGDAIRIYNYVILVRDTNE